jgi:GINS complex subunit 4
MNIDDILASVSNTERIPQRTFDLQALTRAWVAERCASELLPYPEELIDRVMERIKMQVSN